MIEIKQELYDEELVIKNHNITIKNILNLLFDTKKGIELIKSTYPILSNKDIQDTKNYIFNLLEEQININTFKFKAVPSGDYESFCYDVDKETFIKIKNTEPHNHNKSYFNKGLYRIYPDDFHNSENQCLIELKVTRMEE